MLEINNKWDGGMDKCRSLIWRIYSGNVLKEICFEFVGFLIVFFWMVWVFEGCYCRRVVSFFRIGVLWWMCFIWFIFVLVVFVLVGGDYDVLFIGISYE